MPFDSKSCAILSVTTQTDAALGSFLEIVSRTASALSKPSLITAVGKLSLLALRSCSATSASLVDDSSAALEEVSTGRTGFFFVFPSAKSLTPTSASSSLRCGA
eukprot:CAMPEP_0181516606 /NCGR_PEP_ID=MMETSP1110-20121109/64213_1 /TAXON_ID=174948 /ORGANISM="Symbiodinium sp., Strain CCMP421" /LENGTH=103 /DNA_ID=CAMNT_0023646733 /DNA_START=301 /DNA_END=609 /DNA_ORIENTATION=-